MDIPPVGADGLRRTVNTGLDGYGTLWNFRSVWNVAALNCLNPEDEQIVAGYGKFLTDNRKALATANAELDKQYRAKNSSRSNAVKAREAFMTQVYNYFALPPVRTELCSNARSLASSYLATKPGDINQFAAVGLAQFEGSYQQFFTAYEQYRVDSAEWDARYGAQYGASQPGYVATHPGSGSGIGAALADNSQPVQTGAVNDPETGAQIPIIAAPEDEAALPVVQPVPGGK
ncbi:hypothetical protein GRI89_00460 [Altererythrobacter salegens]|uniref:Uncharacterized protein n=1 Tax=Croceibacterium salegens TaxID=1737568 RepID=A0A6I4SSS8_9SPHN|nr:hypothetical protein [Croceibacterium salegens]MXO58016.1 hypothetical protein [Croceibacterium salegens]